MSITTLLAISLGAILTNNFIFSQFLGICPFLGVSKKIDTAVGMGAAVTFVMGLASAFCYLINLVLVALHLEFMQTVAYILVIAGLVQFVEMFLKKNIPTLYTALGVYLPLITTNCAVLGVALLNTQNDYNFIESVVYGITGGLGFLLAIFLFAAVREQLEISSDNPKAFDGFPIALVTGKRNMSTLIWAIVVLGALAIIFGLILAVAAKVFEVEVDPRLPEIQACLAGANCGGCGYPGCGGCAEAILAGKAPVTACAPAGPENAAKIAAIMGMEAPSGDKMVAHVLCNGGCNAKENFEYRGVKDCLAATKVCGGDAKACKYGCFGFGSCVAACKFDAIHVVDGVAVVDKEKCTNCGACRAACPHHLIVEVPYKQKVFVNCSNKDKGPAVTKVCANSCIACGRHKEEN